MGIHVLRSMKPCGLGLEVCSTATSAIGPDEWSWRLMQRLHRYGAQFCRVSYDLPAGVALGSMKTIQHLPSKACFLICWRAVLLIASFCPAPTAAKRRSWKCCLIAGSRFGAGGRLKTMANRVEVARTITKSCSTIYL